jgi:hypothetical protein
MTERSGARFRGKTNFLSETSRSLPASNRCHEYLPRRQSGRGVKLTSHLHIMSRLRLSGDIPLLPLYVRLHILDRDNFTFTRSCVRCIYYYRSILQFYSDCLRAGRSGDRIPVGARFSTPVQTGPEAHPASCTMGTSSFPGVSCGRGVTLTPHHF